MRISAKTSVQHRVRPSTSYSTPLVSRNTVRNNQRTSLRIRSAASAPPQRLQQLEVNKQKNLCPDGTLRVMLPVSKSLETIPGWQLSHAGGALGVEVKGPDLANLTEGELTEIKRLFLEFKVLVFPDQDITPQEHIAFTSNWGPVEPHALGSRKDIHPDGVPEEILCVQNTMKKGQSQARNDYWHSDLSFMPEPVDVSVLYGKTVPVGYGDTMFANCTAGYNSLSDGMQQWLEGVKGVYTSKWARPGASANQAEVFANEFEDVCHPIVRTHPETGEKSLYIGQQHMSRFEGMSVEESQPMMKFLVDKVTKAENVYRHHWRPKDIVMWDNRCTLHYAVFDYGPEHDRMMQRATAAGSAPF